jgi:hypothetical protein
MRCCSLVKVTVVVTVVFRFIARGGAVAITHNTLLKGMYITKLS